MKTNNDDTEIKFGGDNTAKFNVPPPLVLNATFDETEDLMRHDWDALRYTLVKGKWRTEKKEKKYMFFKKIWNSMSKLQTKVEKVYDEVFEDSDYSSRTYWGLKYKVKKLEERVDELSELTGVGVDCHTCGCVVRKEIAFRGHDRIERITYHRNRGGLGDLVERAKEKTRETWYCKLHRKGKTAYGSRLKDK